MKFSDREQIIIEVLKSRKEHKVSLDHLLIYVRSTKRADTINFRSSVISSMRNLSKKLEIFGIDLHLVSSLGRGNKAFYKASSKIKKFRLE